MLAALASSPATKALDPDPFPRHSLRHAVYAALLHFGFETAVYVVIDVGKLMENLANDAALAGKVVEHLLHLIAKVSPGAKKGSTAPYAYADLVLIETGARQPRSLASAFRDPARPTVKDATQRLFEHLLKLDRMYGAKETRRLSALEPETKLPETPPPVPLDDLARAVAAEVAGG